MISLVFVILDFFLILVWFFLCWNSKSRGIYWQPTAEKKGPFCCPPRSEPLASCLESDETSSTWVCLRWCLFSHRINMDKPSFQDYVFKTILAYFPINHHLLRIYFCIFSRCLKSKSKRKKAEHFANQLVENKSRWPSWRWKSHLVSGWWFCCVLFTFFLKTCSNL